MCNGSDFKARQAEELGVEKETARRTAFTLRTERARSRSARTRTACYVEHSCDAHATLGGR
eukprot:5405641-Pleurochrysis_carterae.AAC.1